MSAVSYAESGHDYDNKPPHAPPSYLSELSQKIYNTIQFNLVEQAKHDKHGNGVLLFKQDSLMTILDTEISISQLVEAIEVVLRKEKE